MIDPDRYSITNEWDMLNKGFQWMLFINNVNVMIFYFDYFFSYHIKLSEVCNYVLYLGYVNLLLNIMVTFNSPLTLFPIPRGPGRTCMDQLLTGLLL